MITLACLVCPALGAASLSAWMPLISNVCSILPAGVSSIVGMITGTFDSCMTSIGQLPQTVGGV